MSKLRKTLASVAVLATATGIFSLATIPARAATPACGPTCLEVFSPRFGTTSDPAFVETVFTGRAEAGAPMVLDKASNTNTASDIVPHLNKVSGFYAMGMVSSAVNAHYGSLFAAQLEYAPSGNKTGLCVGLADPAYEYESLSLQPCTTPGSTVFIVDTPDAPAATPNYTPLVLGSTDDFVHPWTMVYDGYPTDHPTPRIRVNKLQRDASGNVPIDQLFGTAHGILQSGPNSPKPTIVLVHGAWADSSSWSGEIARLQQDGYPVVAAPNPLRGLSSDSATLADFLSKISGPIVLVGHSYGGAVISDAATGDPNVKALVYVDAYIPAAGENIAQLSTAASALAPGATNPTSVFKLVPYPGAPDGVVDTYLLPDVFFNDFAPDIPQRDAAVLEAEQSPTSLIAVGEPLNSTPAWLTIPSWDVVGTQDKIIPEAAQLFMANRAHSNVTTVDGSHLSLISHADAVTSVIESAADATR